MNYNQTVTDYIANASESQVEILETLRELIHKNVEGVSEAIKWGFPVFGNPKDFVYFRTAKAHITLGFYNFDKIEDADKLLEGSGKTFRNLKIRSMKDVNADLIGEWLKAVSA